MAKEEEGVSIVEDCLEEVDDNRSVGMTKVDTIYAEIDTGRVDEVKDGVVIMIHYGQTSAGERILQWLC